MSEITKIYVTGNRPHSGKTLLSAYLANALGCELESPENGNAVELYAGLVKLAKAGWFHAPKPLMVSEIRVRLVRRLAHRSIQRVLEHITNLSPHLEIVIVQSDHRLMDEAEYRVARALADIGLPGYYFSKWNADTPLSLPKVAAKVYDCTPSFTDGDPTDYISKDDLVSGVMPIRRIPIDVMVPVTPTHSLLMLLHKFPSELDNSYQIGVNHTVRYTIDMLPPASTVVRLITVNGEWGLLSVISADASCVYAFKREHVYDLMQYCDAANGQTIVVPAVRSSADLYQQITSALLGHLVASNKTRCTNRVQSLNSCGEQNDDRS